MTSSPVPVHVMKLLCHYVYDPGGSFWLKKMRILRNETKDVDRDVGCTFVAFTVYLVCFDLKQRRGMERYVDEAAAVIGDPLSKMAVLGFEGRVGPENT